MVRTLRFLPIVTMLVALGTSIDAQERDNKVRGDREQFAGKKEWVYNNLDEARRVAREQNLPLLVVVRCIPCEACAGFDEQVARRDARIADLMDKFVCVRIVQGNGLDLALFQYDYDMSFAAQFMNADN